MTDKFRKTNPLVISFLEGEGPTANKLNQLATQVRSGTGLLEKAVGDTWNQSGDSVLNTTPIQIPNLARVIGELKYLNPVIYPVKEAFNFRDQIGAKYSGKSEGYLTFPAISGVVTEVNSMATFTTEVVDEYLVDSATEYWFDSNTGKFKIGAPLTAEIAEYTVDTSQAFQHYDQVLPSLIPDPRQNGFEYVRIEKSGTDYYLHLPPRRPLTLTGTDFTFSGIVPERYPHALDTGVAAAIETNEAAVILGGGAGQAGHSNRLYWQSTAVNALNDAHYRYQFPKEIQDWLDTSPTAGTQMPEGYMYLWNTSTNTMIEDVKFYVADGAHANKAWVAKVTSTAFDFDTVDSASESEADYSSSNLVLICPGASITRSIWHLFSQFHSHNHSKYLNSDGAISHQSLKNVNPPTNVATQDHFGRYPTYLGVWPMSAWTSDEHNSLLSRAGSQTDSARVRDKWNNAILGHVIIANADTSGAESYLDPTLTDGSFKLHFGDLLGPYVYGSGAGEITVSGETSFLGDMTVTGINAGNYAIDTVGYSPNGGGIYAIGRGIYSAGYFVGGETSGAGVKGFGGGDSEGIYAKGGSTDGRGLWAIGGGANGVGVYGQGAGLGAAISGVAINGPGVVAQSDTSSPTSAALRIVPQDDYPTVSGTGDIFVHDPDGGGGVINHFNGQVWERVVPQVYSLPESKTITSATSWPAGYTIPANSLRTGSVIEVEAYGYIDYSAGGPANINIRVMLGAQAILATGNIAVSSDINFYLKGHTTIYTTGGPGTAGHGGIAVLGSTWSNTVATSSPDTTGSLVVSIEASSMAVTATLYLRGFRITIT